MVTTDQRRAVVSYVATSAEVNGASRSERRACRYIGVHRALRRYVVQHASDEALPPSPKPRVCRARRRASRLSLLPRLRWRRLTSH